MNVVRGRLDDGALVVGDQRLELPQGLVDRRSGLAAYRGRDVAVGIRPEHLLDAAAAPRHPRLRCEVKFSEALPPERLVHATVAAQPVLTDAVLEIAADVDEAAVEQLQEAPGRAARDALRALRDLERPAARRVRPRGRDRQGALLRSRDGARDPLTLFEIEPRALPVTATRPPRGARLKPRPNSDLTPLPRSLQYTNPNPDSIVRRRCGTTRQGRRS